MDGKAFTIVEGESSALKKHCSQAFLALEIEATEVLASGEKFMDDNQDLVFTTASEDAAVAGSLRQETKDKRPAEAATVLGRAASSSGVDPLQALGVQELLKQLGARSRRKRRESSSSTSSSASSESSSGSVHKPKKSSGVAKAMGDYRQMKKDMKRHPMKHVRRYVRQVEEDLGVTGELPYRLTDHGKRIPWGKQKGLQRVYFLLGAILEQQLKGNAEQAALLTTQSLRAVHQTALDGGNWNVAWMLTGLQDPFVKRKFGGEEESLETIAAYMRATQELERRAKTWSLSQDSGAAPESEEPEQRGTGKGGLLEQTLLSYHGGAAFLEKRSGDNANGDEVVKACHKVRACDVVPVYNKLLQSGVAVLLPEEQALYDSTGWCGPDFPMARDDLKKYFYLLKHIPEWRYVLAFKVVCMGDLNGVDICQQTHVELLRDCGAMRPEHVLEYQSPLPLEPTLEGLYIDDHVVVQITPKKKHRRKDPDPKWNLDETLIGLSRRQYQRLGVPVSLEKRFTKQSKFTAWGTEVCSASGRVGAPQHKLRQLCQLVCRLLRLGRASKKCLQQVVGLFVHPFTHRRLCMSIFSEIYSLIESWPSKGEHKIPKVLAEELLGACLVLPLAATNVRWPVSRRLSSTDASLTGAGRCATRTTSSLSRVLHRAAEHKGERVRLDWATVGIAPLTDMKLPSRHIERLAGLHRWSVTESKPFRKRQHINILELEVIHREYSDLVSQVKGGLRCVNLTDSRVVLGAVAKGRSSSRNLNRVLRRCLALSLAGQKILYNVWVSTHANPSDFPSRFKQIPPPESPLPDELALLGAEWFKSQEPLTKQQLWAFCSQEVSSSSWWHFKLARLSHAYRSRLLASGAVLFRYLRAQHVVDVQQFMRSARRADALLQAFVQRTCDTPTSRAVRLAKHAVLFCQVLWPRLRHRLPETWALLRALEELQPKKVRVPLPFPLLLCMVVAARIHGCRVRGRSAREWFVFACLLEVGFFAMLRPGELLALRARDVGTLNSLSLGFAHCTLRVAKPKNRRSVGPEQFVQLTHPCVCMWLTHFVNTLAPDQFLWPSSTSAFRKRFQI
ncbi:unnamed protein product, partial [Symbiodinium sp. CCMP2592]